MAQNDPFWNEVLKRLAAANEENATLRRERDDYQRERDDLTRNLENLKREVTHSVSRRSPSPERNLVNIDKLAELEDGIKKAQDSYRKTEEKLIQNNAKIEELAASNERLRRERNEADAQSQASSGALKQAQGELTEARALIESLQKQLSEISSCVKVEVKPEENAALSTDLAKTNFSVEDRGRIEALERQVNHLTTMNLALEQEKRKYQHDLDVVSQKLDKYKHGDQSLRDKLVKLGEIASVFFVQHDIKLTFPKARQKSRPPSLTSDMASIKSMASSTLLVPPEVSYRATERRGSSSRRPSIHLAPPRNVKDSATIQTLEEEEDQAPTPRPVFSAPPKPSRTPPSRQAVLGELPQVNGQAIAMDVQNGFSRKFMTEVLGGSIQPLIVRVSNQSPVAYNDVKSYLCPSVDHNPWCPLKPGEHGYIFVGLGREKDTFNQPEVHNVFVGGPKSSSKDTRRFKYAGKYRAIRVQPLTVEEWASLDLRVRTTYAKTTKEKTKDPRSVELVLAAYDIGELKVPCVLLECIGFDENLYTTMVMKAARPPPPPPAKNSSSSGSQSNKRALEDYEADDDCSRKRRTVAISRTKRTS